MKLSVIITTYNRPDALKKVLEGLYVQTRPPDEILVADDGSTQETRLMLAAFKNRPGPGFCHIWQKDLGFRAARARNKAIAAASGEYLVFLDGDCIPDPWFAGDHLALAEPGFFFQGKRILVSRRASPGFDVTETMSLGRRVRHAMTGRIANAHHIFRVPFFPCSRTAYKLSGIRSCNMGVFKQDVQSVNGFNHDFEGWGREDSEFAARLFRFGIARKEHPFLAICYHLWHRENPRTRLDINDKLLKRALASDRYVCKNGLDSLMPDTAYSCTQPSRKVE